jgi:hypothetical protein
MNIARFMAPAILLLATACAHQQRQPLPFEAPPYVLHQVVFVHNAAVGIDTDAGPFAVSHVENAMDLTASAYAKARGLADTDVVGWVEKYKPTFFIAASIDCAKAHDGPFKCGGFISKDNAVHIKGDVSGCLSNTSFVHFFLHYLVGCHTGAMDIEHTSAVFKELEPAINLELAQKCTRAAVR